MMRQFKLWIAAGFSMLLGGCVITLDSAPDDDKTVEDYLIDRDGEEIVFDAPSKYDFTILGDSNKVTLKGNISKILITGSYNYVTIEEDTYIEVLSITGMHNIVAQDSNLSLFVDRIELSGSSNVLSIDDYEQLVDTGDDNQILSMDSDIPSPEPSL